jgi:hypothetical protein
MDLLFISYWSADEPLTHSTILPYFRLMARMGRVRRIVFVTVEWGGRTAPMEMDGLANVEHRPFVPWRLGWGPASRLGIFLRLAFGLAAVARREGIGLIDSKGAVAGGIAHWVSRLSGVPYMVESFEPHSDYMADCGIWHRTGLYYRAAGWMEGLQRRHARHLITVTHNYRTWLVDKGVPAERVKVIPSITDLDAFAFNPEERRSLRLELGWEDRAIGVYLGKFGGLYYDREAYALFGQAWRHWQGELRLLLATNEPEARVRAQLAEEGIPHDHAVVRFLPHHAVPAWLSASDFAFSTIRYTPHGLYQSPVKNGEYWANGLPVLLTHGISDDHHLIQEDPRLGALFDLDLPGSTGKALEHMAHLVRQGPCRQEIMQVAREHRGMHLAEGVYREIFGTDRP